MKKIIQAFVVALAFVAAPMRAVADPVTATLVAIQTFAATSAINAFIVRFVSGLLLSALGAALSKKSASRAASPGITTEATTAGATNAQTFILGNYATGGNMVVPPYSHPNSGSTPNKYLTYVADLSDLPIDGVRRVIVNGEYLGDIVAGAGEFDFDAKFIDGVPHMSFNVHDGRQVAPDAYLRSNYGAHPDRPWSADMIGTGVAYLVARFTYNRKVFSSMPTVRFEVGGLALYDPRFDGSVGGSGAQRWADPATWAFSENPMAMIYNILRGITFPDGAVWGGGAAAEDLPLANWFAALNACDQDIALVGGGVEPQFRAGLEVTVDQEPAEVIEILLKSCSAEIVEIGGAYKVRVGPISVPGYIFTDADIVVDGPRQLTPHPGLDGIFNGIEARFPSPEALWETDDAPARYSATWEAEDGDRRLVASVDLPAVPFPVQVQRLMAAWIKDARRFRRHSIALPPSAAVLEPLDAVAWSSMRHGYTGKTFEIGEMSDDFLSLAQAITMREREAGDFVWTPGADQIAVSAPGVGVTAPASITLENYGVAAVSLTDAAGLPRRAAIKVYWTAADLEFLSWAIFRATDSAGNVVASVLVSDFTGGAVFISEGIIGGEIYTITVALDGFVPVVNPPALVVTAPAVLLSAADFDPSVSDYIEGIASRSLTVLELENINIIEQDNQNPAWLGNIASDAAVTSAIEAGHLYITPSIAGQVVIYSDPTPFDLGEAYPVRISAGVGAEFWNAAYTWDSWGAWSNVARWAGNVAGCSAQAQIRTTLNDPADGAAVWSDWAAPISLLVEARGVQTRYILTLGAPEHRVRLSYGATIIDVPDRMESKRGVEVPDTGLNYVFAPAFVDIPVVVASLVDPADGDRLKISAEAPGGVRVDILNAAGAGVAGTINIHAKGYGRKGSI
jgi:hypothetical protein